jgi:hypothetical protein
MLPSVPEWKSKTVTLTGHATKEPMLLFYCDALDCVEYLFGNPIFANQIDFHPVRLYRDSERMIRIYTEWITGNAAWDMQVRPYTSFNYVRSQPYASYRNDFQTVQRFSESSSPPTRPIFQS